MRFPSGVQEGFYADPYAHGIQRISSAGGTPKFITRVDSTVVVVCESFRQNFDRNVASEFVVVSFIHFSHAARTDSRKNFIRA
jgi:hypothetical protein